MRKTLGERLQPRTEKAPSRRFFWFQGGYRLNTLAPSNCLKDDLMFAAEAAPTEI
jgi:hypothetical protein